jgi:transglutaminase-like putative cysteine protease
MAESRVFLQASASVESDHPRVRELAAQIVADAEDVHEKARRLFVWVRDQIAYSLYNPFWLPEHYRASSIIERGHGYCVQKAVVLAALARASGIPARLLFADLINHRAAEEMTQLMGTNLFTYHCYDELLLGEYWVKVVPSFDSRLCSKHEYPLVEFDGRHDALFPPRDAKGRDYMEYVRQHGAFADVPIEQMLQSWVDVYGSDRVEFWKKAFLTMQSQKEGGSA